MASRILVVGGLETDRDRALTVLGQAGYEAEMVPDGVDAFELLLALPYDLALLEAKLDRLDSPALIAKLHGRGIKTPIVVWTSLADAANLPEIQKLGVAEYIDKDAPGESLLEKVGTLLAQSSTAPSTKKPCEALAALSSSAECGGMLAIDDQDSDHQKLRALLPAPMRFDACRTLNDGLARAHGHCYNLVLVDTDASMTNLKGTTAQLHMLLPNAAVVGMAMLAKDGSGAGVERSLLELDFDDVIFKPLKSENVTLLVERWCSRWEDLVMASDCLLRVSRRRSRVEHHERYFCELTARLEAAVRSLMDSCFDQAIVDLTLVETLSPIKTGDVLRRLQNIAKNQGLTLRFVLGKSMIVALRKVEGTLGWGALPVFPTVEAAYKNAA